MAQKPKILNQAAIDAANRANAAIEARNTQLALQQQTARETISGIQKGLYSTYGSRLLEVYGEKQGTPEFQSKYVQPIKGAESTLGIQPETLVNVPAPMYGPTGSTSESQSAFDLLFEQFSQYGLEALIEPLRGFIEEGISPAEFTLRLRATKAYQNRFAANKARIQKGLRALSEAEYIGMEDAYQDIMRRYGLPESYYAETVDPETGIKVQKGFEKLIAGDVSNVELEDRIATAQNRVLNAPAEIRNALTTFYGNEITNGDILAYTLDPEKAIQDIKRKVLASEIQGAANMAGLNILKAGSTAEQIAAARARATELAGYGVTGEQAREGFRTVAEVAPRGGMLAEIYKQSPYTQATVEQEVFGLTGATEAAKQRKKLTQLEQASFAGQAGVAGGALARDRAGSF